MAASVVTREVREETIDVGTTDATITTLWQYTMPDESITSVRAVVIGKRVGVGTGLIWDSTATYTRTAAGAATLLGQMVDVHYRSVSTWSAAFDTSTNDVRLRVTGVAAQNINWQAHVTVTTHDA